MSSEEDGHKTDNETPNAPQAKLKRMSKKNKPMFSPNNLECFSETPSLIRAQSGTIDKHEMKIQVPLDTRSHVLIGMVLNVKCESNSFLNDQMLPR